MKTSELIWQDAQHQDLLAIVNTLKHSTDPDPALLDKLADYVAYHFSLEEKYMQLTNYPRAKEHIHAHRAFEDKINGMKRSKLIMQAGFKQHSFRKEVTDYLNDWLIKHVMGIDKDLEDHIMKSRFK